MTGSIAVVLIVGADVAAADVGPLVRRLRAALRNDPTAGAVCDVSALREPSLQTVSVLARLQMRARALGAPLRLVNASPRLRELVELAGLSAVLPSGNTDPA